MDQAKILVVDDEPDIRELVSEILEDEGHEVTVAEDGAAARAAFARNKPDLVLLDIWMPDVDGITLLKEWSAGGKLDCPVVIMSGHGTVETAVEATRLGAHDFIQKPVSLARLLAVVSQALDSRPTQEKPASRTAQPLASEPIGSSALMQVLRKKAEQAARHDSPVLITGEPGSGRGRALRATAASVGRTRRTKNRATWRDPFHATPRRRAREIAREHHPRSVRLVAARRAGGQPPGCLLRLESLRVTLGVTSRETGAWQGRSNIRRGSPPSPSRERIQPGSLMSALL